MVSKNNSEGNMSIERREELRIEQLMSELQSDLAELVRVGDLTDEEANEFANCKADQWANGLG